MAGQPAITYRKEQQKMGKETKKKFYHATDFKNLNSIMDEGIKTSCDGVVYLTEKPEEALRFVALRFYEEVLVIEVELEESKVEETFDHNPNFFKCKAFGYPETIQLDSMVNFWKYSKNS